MSSDTSENTTDSIITVTTDPGYDSQYSSAQSSDQSLNTAVGNIVPTLDKHDVHSTLVKRPKPDDSSQTLPTLDEDAVHSTTVKCPKPDNSPRIQHHSTSSYTSCSSHRRHESKVFQVINYGNISPVETKISPFFTDISSKLNSVDSGDGRCSSIPSIVIEEQQKDNIVKIDVDDEVFIENIVDDHHIKPETLDIPIRHHDTLCIGNKDDNLSYYDVSNWITATSNNKTKTLFDIAKRGRLFARRKTGRLVEKNGEMKISFTNIPKRNQSFLLDIFTTLLDAKWRYMILLICVAFVSSWILFAGFWMILAYIHGEVGEIDLVEPCVIGVTDFHTALLFSIETQHTIGYGTRAVTAQCESGLILIMVQSIIGVIIQCVMAGVVFAKLARPKRRSETIIFSKNAVITKQDGQYCLAFRVGDMRRSQLIGANLYAMLVRKRVTSEGEEIPLHQYHLALTAESDDHDQYIFLAWPLRIVHHITPDSPLWNMSAEDLLADNFEIIVVLEGTAESTGMTTQVRTSYLPAEILWGHVLDPLLTNRKDNGRYEIDYGKFHSVTPVSMPEISAAQFHSQ